MTAFSNLYGALALECSAPLPIAILERDAAAELVGLVASDLSRVLTGVEQVDLALAAVSFDPCEVLRPGWPVHAALTGLAQAAPEFGLPRVMGFGGNDGLPDQLKPDPELFGGPLRVLPFVLYGPADKIKALGDEMEEVLLDTGLAQAATALFATEAFGAPLEHSRYLSLHDLMAMMAMQYDHAGLGALWPLIEVALLRPEDEEWLDEPPEPLLHWADGQVRMAMMDLAAWSTAGFAPEGTNAENIERIYDQFQMRQRLLAAVLGGHGIVVQYDHCGAGEDPREVVAA